MGSLSEGKRKNYGKKGGDGGIKGTRITPFDRREARANIQDLSRSGRQPLSQADILRAGRPPGASAAQVPGAPEAPTWIGRDDQAIRYAQELEKANRSQQLPKTADDVRFQTKEPQLRQAAQDILGGTRKPSSGSELVGGRTAPSGTGQAFRDTTIRPPVPPKPSEIKQSEVSARARRFRQSFGTPTGADPFTGRPTYRPLDSLTKLPSSRTGRTPRPQDYAKVQVGDLDTKRLVRTQGPQGVPTDRGVENFLLNRETKGALGGRNARQISPEQGKAALERVKSLMGDPEEVSRVKSQIQQEVGGRRAQLETPPSRPSRSTAAATSAPKPEPVKQSEVSTRAQTFRQQSSAPSSSSATRTALRDKVKQTLNLTPGQPPNPTQTTVRTTTVKPTATVSQKQAPIPDFRTSQPDPRITVNTTTTPQVKPSLAQRSGATVTPTGNITLRGSQGTAGPSSRISTGPKPPVVEVDPKVATSKKVTVRQDMSPNLGSRSITTRSGQSTTLRPRTAEPPKPKRDRGGGLAMGAVYGGLSGFDAYQQAISQGKSHDEAMRRAFARGSGATAGSALLGRLGRSLGRRTRIPGAAAALEFGGSWIGSEKGGQLANAIAGIDQADKNWMAQANRSIQRGTPAQQATSKSGNRAIVRDASGQERVGYKAYRNGNVVYKHGNTPQSLRYTSSNPLERMGRTIAAGGYDLPFAPISSWLKSRYAASDEATRKANVATQRRRGG